ncbi:E3 ubiquitin ligase BIG BROTHER-related-like [Aristolochia californica]|uniref:E3 ubiquitin ligase BIG BROTHER-related-like n=1 Tax=Aristolochia californica TaxID=171875 RepID=UPI0035E1CF86
MDNSKERPLGGDGGDKTTDERFVSQNEPEIGSNGSSQPPSRTPFTSLSQVDADLALARTLQEQERAYMMLRMAGEVSDYGSSDSGSFVFEDDEVDGEQDEDGEAESDGGEDVFDVHARGAASEEMGLHIDPSAFHSDEAYARALQDAEEREVAVHLMAFTGINDWHAEDPDAEHDSNLPDAWQEVDPDELSYEELLALGDVVGTESRGLSAETIASLPAVTYKSTQDGNADQCVICRLEYEDDESLVVLSCKHLYHPECINNWLQINKVCPVCSAEVSSSHSS